jgi:hypothetical protein
MRGLWRMSRAEEMAEFIYLWPLIQEVQLTQQQDFLVWIWTNDGTYSSKSTYEAQFQGSYCTFNCTAIWKAKVEGKHHFLLGCCFRAKF